MAVGIDQAVSTFADKAHIQTQSQSKTRPASAQPKPLRIAICPPDFDLLQSVLRGDQADATYILQRYIVEGLQAHGHQLTFVAQRNLSETICTRDWQQPAIAPQSWTNRRWFELAGKISWRIQQWLRIPYLNGFSSQRHMDACLQCLPGHDVVYERNGLYKDGVARACRRLGLPYVLFVEADEILEHDYMGKPLTGLLRWRASQMFQTNLDCADCIICVSEQSKRHLVTAWHVPAEKVAVFPNAVDIERFRPRPETRTDVRERLDIGDGPMILFVGSFYVWHDIATLLDSFTGVLDLHPDARLVLAGDGAHRSAMRQRADALGIAHAVRFPGFVSHVEIPQVMSAADVAVAPYPNLDHDLWLSPLKLYEYMASGVPIVASAVGQITEVIQEGKNGLLVPAGSATALAGAINKLLSDTELRVRLGRQARHDVEQERSWERYVSRLERIFAAVQSGHSLQGV